MTAPKNGSLRLGTYRDLWAAEVTERSPALRFLCRARRWRSHSPTPSGSGSPKAMRWTCDPTATACGPGGGSRAVRPGAGFLIDGLAKQSANVLAGAETVQITKVAG